MTDLRYPLCRPSLELVSLVAAGIIFALFERKAEGEEERIP